jgi:hypothetical protein
MLAQPSESGSVCNFADSTRPRKYNRKESDCKRLITLEVDAILPDALIEREVCSVTERRLCSSTQAVRRRHADRRTPGPRPLSRRRLPLRRQRHGTGRTGSSIVSSPPEPKDASLAHRLSPRVRSSAGSLVACYQSTTRVPLGCGRPVIARRNCPGVAIRRFGLQLSGPPGTLAGS